MAGLTGKRAAIAAGIGLAAGFSSGLLGIGGGIIMVPAMGAFLAMSHRRTVANSLFAIIPISIAGVGFYYFAGSRPAVRVDLALVLAIASVLGAPLGAAIVYRVPERALRIGLGVVALLAAFRLLLP